MTDLREKLARAIAITVEKLWDVKISPELDVPDNASFGDLSTNVAFALAPVARRSPKEIASKIVAELELPKGIESAEPAGAGFINFRYAPEALRGLLAEIIENPRNFGRLEIGKGEKILLEFVSANPTGPLNVVSARAAAVGSAIVNILNHAGYEAKSEYYVNDAGNQVKELAASVLLSILEDSGKKVQYGEDSYRGEYVKDLAKKLLKEDDGKTQRLVDELNEIWLKGVFDPTFFKVLRNPVDVAKLRKSLEENGVAKNLNLPKMSEAELISYLEAAENWVLARMLEEIERDLGELGVSFDNFFSEKEFRKTGAVEKNIETLRKKGDLFPKDGAQWFDATKYDSAEEPFVLIKSDDEFTYAAVDIAYHKNKFERGFDRAIDIWGPDHHGHIGRMKAAMKALGYEGRFDVIMLQQVNLIEGGEKVKMSKREGNIVTTRELVEDVGADVAKFFFCARRSEAHLDFDLELARKESDENPVFYIQYAHARISNILEFAKNRGIDPAKVGREELSYLVEPEELDLARKLAVWDIVIERSAREMSPHNVCFYLLELARLFHPFYAHHRVVGDEEKVTLARVSLCKALKEAIALGLEILGISAPENM